MANYDVFNGDADGICALIQLRLANPLESTLITGVKRDIQLLEKISPQKNDQITVLDISLDKNRDSLNKCLKDKANIIWFDHHFAGEIPEDKNLQTFIDTDSNICTSLLVDNFLKGKYRAWAVTAAFGDNLTDSAIHAAKTLSLSDRDLSNLEKLGNYINYNGYGASLDDLHFHPAELYSLLSPYSDPLNFITENHQLFNQLETGYLEDLSKASKINPKFESEHTAVYMLPDKPWSRRVSGVFSNQLTHDHPDRAHAVLTLKPDNNFLVSIRAPLNNKTGADELARQFETGGGRKAAAGINDLPAHNLDLFINTFINHFK